MATVYSGDRDRSLWHRAASLTGPDDHVAAELEAAAERAERRGAADVAVAAFERAAGLSTEDSQRARLLLLAAWLAYELGQFDVSTRLARDTQQLEMAQHERTLLRYMLELGQDNMWSGVAGIRSLVEIAGQFQAAGEPDRALDVLQTASSRFWWGNPDQILRDLVVSAAEALSVPDSSPKLLAVLAQADPVKTGGGRISLMSPDHADPAGMYLVGLAASSVWAYDLALVFLKTAVDGLRARGQLGLLARALAAQAWAAVHAAREPLAVSAAEEGIALARETGQLRLAVTAQLAKAVIAAERGDFAIAEALAREAEAVLLPMGATRMLALVQFIRGRGAVAHQHYEEGLSICGGPSIRLTPAVTRSSARGGYRISLKLPPIPAGGTWPRPISGSWSPWRLKRQGLSCWPRQATRGRCWRVMTRPEHSTRGPLEMILPSGAVTGAGCFSGTADGSAASDGWRNPECD